MLQLNSDRFEEVVNEAMVRVQGAPKDAGRWTRAITKAFEFLTSTALWHLMDDGETLLIVSPQSSQVYEVGEHCERIDGGESKTYCPAYAKGQPCWHRAAKRLVDLYVAEPIQID